MAITEADILSAVEQFLPRTVNFARSSDMGELDRGAVFDRISQIILTALLVDQDSIFFVVYLASQRLLRDIDIALAALENLDGPNQLRGVSNSPAVRMSDISKLGVAQSALLGMSGSLVTDKFGITQFDNFVEAVDDFLVNQVVPNVRDGGNNVKASLDIRESMQILSDAWSRILVRRNKLLEIVAGYKATDMRVKVAANIISAIRQQVSAIQVALPSLATSEHGKRAEGILTDLAAAKASLRIVAEAPTPFGALIVPPASDGFTEADYLAIEGSASVEPSDSIYRGIDGHVFFDVNLTSSSGQTSNPTLGYSSELVDGGVADFTATVDVGDYVTLVEQGERFRVTSVSTSLLGISGKTAMTANLLKYCVTTSPPGQLFESLSASFWTDFTSGETASTKIAEGTEGSWLRINKASGTDGTNIKASGNAAIPHAYRASGLTGSQALSTGDFSAATTFQTSGVLPGDLLYVVGLNAGGNPYTVAYAISETALKITGTWANTTSGSWEIEASAAGHHIELGVDVLSLGIVVTDVVQLTSGTQVGSYSITSFVSASRVVVSATLTHETGIAWKISYGLGKFVSPTGNFLSSGVIAGDKILISGQGTFTILTVDSQTQVTLTSPAAGNFSSALWFIYSSATVTTRFDQDDGLDFEALGVSSYVGGTQAILRVSGVDYGIARLSTDEPDRELFVSTPATVDTGPDAWSIRLGDTTTQFFDYVNTPFAAFEPGDTLVYRPGTPQELRAEILTIVSPSEILVNGPLPQGESLAPYAIIDTYKPGLLLVLGSRRHEITRVVSKRVLEITPAASLTIRTDVEFRIVDPVNNSLSHRILDEAGSAVFAGGLGFPADFVGLPIEIFGSVKQRGYIQGIVDTKNIGVYDALDVSVNNAVGLRDVGYRILAETQGTATSLKTEQVAADAVEVGDLLSVWGITEPQRITSLSSDLPVRSLKVDGLLPARLTDQVFCVSRGGSPYFGKHDLFLTKVAVATLPADTAQLRVSVAQVLQDLGSSAVSVANGVDADLTFNPDDKGYVDTLISPTADFVASSVLYGHRVNVTYPDGQVRKTYVTEILGPTLLRMSPPLPVQVGPLVWAIVRTSVSNALDDSESLRGQLKALRSVLDAYVVPQNQTIINVLNLLKKYRMDRAIEMIYDGKFDEFLSLTSTGGSYSSHARASIQVVGNSTSPSTLTAGAGNSGEYTTLGGVDPKTGRQSRSASRISPNGSNHRLRGEPQTRVALAKAVSDLVGDERIRSMLQYSIDEARNQGIYELTGEIESGVVSDEDPTLPWRVQSGSVKAQLTAKIEAAVAAIQYMVDNPDQFTDVEEE